MALRAGGGRAQWNTVPSKGLVVSGGGGGGWEVNGGEGGRRTCPVGSPAAESDGRQRTDGRAGWPPRPAAGRFAAPPPRQRPRPRLCASRSTGGRAGLPREPAHEAAVPRWGHGRTRLASRAGSCGGGRGGRRQDAHAAATPARGATGVWQGCKRACTPRPPLGARPPPLAPAAHSPVACLPVCRTPRPTESRLGCPARPPARPLPRARPPRACVVGAPPLDRVTRCQ